MGAGRVRRRARGLVVVGLPWLGRDGVPWQRWPGDALLGVAVALLVAALGWLLCWVPRLEVTPRGLDVIEAFSRQHLDWSQVTGVAVTHGSTPRPQFQEPVTGPVLEIRTADPWPLEVEALDQPVTRAARRSLRLLATRLEQHLHDPRARGD
nr:PH domain-containing protein [Angustibacter aerolatus]